jgi:hypothetical protein
MLRLYHLFSPAKPLVDSADSISLRPLRRVYQPRIIDGKVMLQRAPF